ncbi:hypothetical protein J6590_037526 [Homalodisca vitripennis]|nr:hypothetical protein J6590_037526 [Homalodisca vitripennis]
MNLPHFGRYTIRQIPDLQTTTIVEEVPDSVVALHLQQVLYPFSKRFPVTFCLKGFGKSIEQPYTTKPQLPFKETGLVWRDLKVIGMSEMLSANELNVVMEFEPAVNMNAEEFAHGTRRDLVTPHRYCKRLGTHRTVN